MSPSNRQKSAPKESLPRRMLARVVAALQRLLHTPIRIFRLFCELTGFVVLTTGLVAGSAATNFYGKLPNVEAMSFATLAELAEKRVEERLADKHIRPHWIPITSVSRDFLYSIIASEDATFFEHDGLNYDAIVTSAAENLKEHRPAFGGSTITQQVVKNVFLDFEKTISRKVKEVILTRRLERTFSKNQILEVYLNIAEFGPDLYGVEAAAKKFFNKTPQEINAAEGAFIALMLPSPKRNFYAIYENKNLTLARRKRINRVLRDMLYQEFITDAQFRQYIKYDYFHEPVRAPARYRR